MPGCEIKILGERNLPLNQSQSRSILINSESVSEVNLCSFISWAGGLF